MADTRVDYDSEKRIAVVMYGGVSLAIYIAGVAKELASVVRATAPARDDAGRAGVPREKLTAVEKIYRDAASKDGVLTTRVIIDVISGTSAGGINGIFLAKALANDAPLDPVLKLWIEEGDLSMLLNDAQSVEGTPLRPDQAPAALLNGRRMYVKLVEAFDRMDEQTNGEGPSCDAGRVDLFVTTTDIRGEITRLPVANAVAKEKRHRQRFHFTAESAGGKEDAEAENELGKAQNPVLAFAARCTSSFPFAFEPFTWNDAAAMEKARARAAKWTDRLMFEGADYEQRPFGDGGYLDNKPFSYAIDELARRQSALDVERTLIYVEPDPEKLLEKQLEDLQKEKPDAIGNTLSALTLPGYETIREDLERVVGRNRNIRQIKAIEQSVEEALRRRSAALERFDPGEWTNIESLKPLVERYGAGYADYHQLKLRSVTGSIAALVCSAAQVAGPDQAEVVRELAEKWVKAAYPSFKDELQLLLDADLQYRLRRFDFLLRRLPPSAPPEKPGVRSAVEKARDGIYGLREAMQRDLGAEVAKLRADVLADAVLARIGRQTGDERDASIASLLEQTRGEATGLKQYLATRVRDEVRRMSDAVWAALPQGEEPLAELRETYEAFENFDMFTYPVARSVQGPEPADAAALREWIERAGADRQLLDLEKTVAGVLRMRTAALKPFTSDDWLRIDRLDPLVERYGLGYAAYHRFKMESVVESIASLVCSAGHVGRPELVEVIRDLAQIWVLDSYPSFRDQLQLLLDADLEYRLRKLSFVLRRLPATGGADVDEARSALKRAVDDLYGLRKAMRRALREEVLALRKPGGLLSDGVLAPIADEKGKERDASVAELLSRTRATAARLKEYFGGDVRKRVRAISDGVSGALKPASEAMAAIRATYDAFENFDMVVYPIVAHGEVDEAVEVKITRISPADMKARSKPPLAGVQFGHFGAFLEEQWRHNDILCGRLDAAETILRQVLKDPQRIEAAHEAIVNDMLRPHLEARVFDLPPSARQEALAVVSDSERLCKLFKDGHAYDLELDRARQVTSAGRAGIIIEKILRTWAAKKGLPASRIPRFAVLLFAMLGQVAIPRTLHRTVASYWGRLLALLFILIGVGGAVTNENAVMMTGIKGVAVLSALGLGTLLIAGWLRDPWARRTVRALEWLAVIAVVVAAAWAVDAGASEVARRIRLNEWITPFDKFFIGVGLGMLIGACFQDAWRDLKWLVTVIAHRLRPGTRH
ncbi:MAG TPA: patatin-like protein [Myxococcales bacterium]